MQMFMNSNPQMANIIVDNQDKGLFGTQKGYEFYSIGWVVNNKGQF